MNPGVSVSSVIVIAKQPRPGRVKTRLTPALSHRQAADVAAAALRDTLAAAALVPARQRVLAFDGDPSAWLPAGWQHVAQPAGGLDVRLAAAFEAAHAFCPGPAVLVGMDTPQLRPEHLGSWDPDTHGASLGLASDGGFWALGLTDPALATYALIGVPMSTERTGSVQLDRLRALGLEVALLDTLTDVDTIDTAHEVARLAPLSRFALALDTFGLGRTA